MSLEMLENYFQGGAHLTVGHGPHLAQFLRAICMAGDGQKLYVDGKSLDVANSERNGSSVFPFRTVQDALTYLEELPGTDLYLIELANRTYSEALTYNGNHPVILKGQFEETDYGTVIDGSGLGPALTITNSTYDGLTAYRAGTYVDLVNKGDAGCPFFGLINIALVTNAALNAVECLGVMGDAAADQTEFLENGILFYRSVVQGDTGLGLYARNSGIVVMYNSFDETGIELFNCARVSIDGRVETFTTEFDVADPSGYFAGGFVSSQSTDTRFHGNVDINQNITHTSDSDRFDGALACVDSTLTTLRSAIQSLWLSGAASVTLRSSPVHGFVDLDDTSELYVYGDLIDGDIGAEAGASYTSYGTHVTGDMVFAAGAGVVTIYGGSYDGVLTDPGPKVQFYDRQYLGRTDRLPEITALDATTGTHTAAGANLTIRGTNFLRDQEFAHLVLSVSLDLIACEPGAVGNDFTVEVVDTGMGGLSAAMVANDLVIDQGGSASDEDTIATYLNNAARDNYQLIRANSGGGLAAVPVTAQTPLADGAGRGFVTTVGGVVAPILHDVGAAVSVANLIDTEVTVTVPDLGPAGHAATDQVPVVVRSEGHLSQPIGVLLV